MAKSPAERHSSCGVFSLATASTTCSFHRVKRPMDAASRQNVTKGFLVFFLGFDSCHFVLPARIQACLSIACRFGQLLRQIKSQLWSSCWLVFEELPLRVHVPSWFWCHIAPGFGWRCSHSLFSLLVAAFRIDANRGLPMGGRGGGLLFCDDATGAGRRRLGMD